jgi:hypothetical protein
VKAVSQMISTLRCRENRIVVESYGEREAALKMNGGSHLA